jgi:hypothetical protein
MVYQITLENQNKVRDMFKLNGLNDLIYYGSFFVVFFIEFFIQAIILTFIYTFKFNETTIIYGSTNPILFFLILLVYGINLILFAILISIFFRNASVAVVISILVFVMCDIIEFFVDFKYNKTLDLDQYNVKIIQIIICIICNPFLKLTIRVINELEFFSSGANFSNLFETTLQYNYLSIGLNLLMGCFAILLNLFLIYYITSIYSFQYGLANKSWYFPIEFLIKCFFSKKEESISIDSSEQIENSKFFEKENSKNKIKIKIQNLVKKYKNKTAISNLNFNIYEYQLTALLGN